MIDYKIFECEIEPTREKDVEVPAKGGVVPSVVTCPLARDRQLRLFRKHLEQVYNVDRVLLWKMSHCTAQTQMIEILAGLRIVRQLEKAIQRRLFEHIRQSSLLSRPELRSC